MFAFVSVALGLAVAVPEVEPEARHRSIDPLTVEIAHCAVVMKLSAGIATALATDPAPRLAGEADAARDLVHRRVAATLRLGEAEAAMVAALLLAVRSDSAQRDVIAAHAATGEPLPRTLISDCRATLQGAGE
ncbi:MAG: hypothetical protein ACFBWO_10265 [Paracoccaceae bacterium]